jgi:membrane carboxypeptidase/penicillin-binding protein PbpC
VSTQRVCTASGRPAGPYCTHTRTADCIPAADRQCRCPICRRAWIDVASGQLVPDAQAGRHGLIARTVCQWPAAVAAWMRQTGRRVDTLPEPAPGGAMAEAARPRILSPADGQEFILLTDRPASDQRVPFVAAVAGEGGRVFWFLDDELLAAADPDAPLHWALAPGSHHLRCVDAQGRWATVRFLVR